MLRMVESGKGVYWIAAVVLILAQLGPLSVSAVAQDEIIKLVIDELKSGDPERQTGAIAIVRDIPGPAITKTLTDELPHLSPPVQVQVLSTLADRGDPTALPAVLKASRFQDESVRLAALKAVGQLGDASSVPLLAQRAAETRGAEQKAARDSLYRLRGDGIDAAVLEHLASSDADVKVELIKAVGERNITEGFTSLLKATRDSDRRVRRESFKVLKIIAGPEQLPALVDLLQGPASESDRNEAEKTVAAVAHKIEDANSQAAAVLAVLPKVKDAKDRASLLRVLGRIGDNHALPALRDALGSSEKAFQDAALRALCDWPTSEPVPDLLAVATDSDNRTRQILALRGFVRLLGLDSDRSAAETVALYAQAMDLAPNTAERKRVLSGLGSAASRPALDMAATYLDDETLKLEAESAVVRVAGAIYATCPDHCREILDRVIAYTKNDTIREQALEILHPSTTGETAP